MKITVYQDTYCPWCYVGKRNLERAIEQFEGKVNIEYKSFFLNPDIPSEGMDKDDYFKGRYDPAYFAQMEQHLVEKATKAGIKMQFTDEQRIPNTLLSHRLGKLYPEKKEALIQRYYEAYFEENVDIGKIEELLMIANQVGIDPDEARFKLLETNEKKDEVFRDYTTAVKLGIRAVPTFVFNNEEALQGAHDPDMILKVMERIANRERINLQMQSEEL